MCVAMAAANEKTNHRCVLLDKYLANPLETTSMKITNKRIKLNWGKLLGFSQVKAPYGEQRSKVAKAMIGSPKTGAKRPDN
jgi:hypothetical protein